MRVFFSTAAIALALAATALPSAASAATVVDRSPDVLGGAFNFNASNQAGSQNFLVQFTLASDTTLRAAAVYASFFGALGDDVVIKFRNDVGGAPDTSNLAELSSSITVLDSLGTSQPNNRRLAANFAPLALSAGTYWFGMSGDGVEITWSLSFRDRVGADPLWQLSGNNLQFSFNGDTAAPFQLYDTPVASGAIPEPASWALLIAGFGLAGAALRRRTAATA